MSLLRRLRRRLIITFIRATEARQPYEHTVGPHTLTVAPGLGYATNRFGLHRASFVYPEFLARCILLRPDESVLEIGTGCGVIAASLADRAAHVVATDINPRAAACARANVSRNRLTNVEVRVGDMFAPVGAQRFDVVVWHLPYYLGEPPTDPSDGRHFFLGGRSLITRFLLEVRDHLTERGRVYFALGTIEDTSFIREACAAADLEPRAVATWAGVAAIEGIVVFRAEHRRAAAGARTAWGTTG